jgi:hypothetical protein
MLENTIFWKLDLGESKVAQHVYGESHRVVWDESRILEIESNSRQRNRPIWDV